MAVNYKVPEENGQYPEWSAYITEKIAAIIKRAIEDKNNLIFIRTNLRRAFRWRTSTKLRGRLWKHGLWSSSS